MMSRSDALDASDRGLKPRSESWKPWDWHWISHVAVTLAARLSWRGGVRDALAVDDLAQEALARLWEAVRAGERVEFAEAWLRGTMIHLLVDRARGATGGLHHLDDEAPLFASADRFADPVECATMHEMSERASAFLERLPLPDRQIAILQYVHGWPRREVAAWLRGWRPVGQEETRRLFRRCHAMLAAIGRGENPRCRWASCWTKGKNPWLTTPPPAVHPTGGKFACAKVGPWRRSTVISSP